MNELSPQTKHQRDYSVGDIFRLSEKFRHLAKNFSDVFIQASRQGVVHQIETDPEESEMREELRFFGGISRRLRERLKRVNYSKPQLVSKPAEQLTQTQQSVSFKQPEAKVQPLQRKEEKAPVTQASSLLDAANRLKSAMSPKLAEEGPSSPPPGVSKNVIQLSPEELPKYKKYKDLAEQFLEAKQIPHFKTLLEKAKSELSKDAVALLEDLARQRGLGS